MRMVRCDVYKNHFYDADKFSACPHCAQLRQSGGRQASPAQPGTAPYLDPGDSKTVLLSEAEETAVPVAEQVKNIGISGTVEDIKTVAMYGFEDEDTEPVVGWLAAAAGEEKGRSYELRSGKNTIGRNGSGAETDISIDGDHSVSRGVQAVLIYEPIKRQFLLQPASGSSLVYLNDELLMSYCPIKAYDRIMIGRTKLIFIPLCGEKFSWDEAE